MTSWVSRSATLNGSKADRCSDSKHRYTFHISIAWLHLKYNHQLCFVGTSRKSDTLTQSLTFARQRCDNCWEFLKSTTIPTATSSTATLLKSELLITKVVGKVCGSIAILSWQCDTVVIEKLLFQRCCQQIRKLDRRKRLKRHREVCDGNFRIP